MGIDAFSEISNQAIKVTLMIASPMLLEHSLWVS